MPLIDCPECHRPVSDKAAACPQCGHPTSFEYGPSGDLSILTEPQKKKRSGRDTVIGFIVLVVIIAAIVSHDSPSDKTTPPAPILPSCKSDWRLCADNADLVNNFSGISKAQAACKLAAEKLAKYGDPDFPWLSFSTFYNGNTYLKSGVVTLIEKNAKFSNGFGAMVHTAVECSYDLAAKKVLDSTIFPN